MASHWDDCSYYRPEGPRPSIIDLEALEEAMGLRPAGWHRMHGDDEQTYYVVCYANQPRYKGTDSFLSKDDTGVHFVSDLGKAMFFSHLKDALHFAVLYPQHDDAHEMACIQKAKRISKWELSELT